MGLPTILIAFITLAVTLIKRSQRGVVALIIKDSTKITFDTKIYKSIDEIVAADWSATNKGFIELAFKGSPNKVIVERIAADAADYNTALGRLKNKKWNWLAIPGIAAEDVDDIATWIKTERDTNKKTFKVVLPEHVGDHEGIVNFSTGDIKVGATTYTTAQFCARIAGILAGLPLNRSCTYFELPEVESITESADPDADIEAGKLILINDGEKIKIARGVNSLTTLISTKGADFQKIKIVEGIDMMRDDIRNTWENSYVGKYINNYDNKNLFFAAVNAYFRELVRIDVLDPNTENTAGINIEAHKTYIQGKGIDTDTLTEQQVKEYNTGSNVYARASVKFVDAMEDLSFDIYM